ncbi:7TM diverse intracellular signaling domain-containing protein [Leptospira jelokensis]|uniref:7TM diverse intracellular signaling domain-containing protein n=1 Tax=Leptospira jelokensis TaxID=2484931 RepID=UPI001090F86C|nr:7TM diverse intracellular signaling domain-containing protein [Leptospira jelokensis]TGM02161.1 serine/threonine protein phosphatase [Leptospira jelokensis]
MYVKKLLSLFLIFGVGTSIFPETPTVNLSNLGETPIFLAKSMLVFEDQTLNLDWDEIQSETYKNKFQTFPSSEEAFNFSYSKSTFWLKVHISNPTEEEIHSNLVIAYPRIKTLDLYVKEKLGIKRIPSGYSVPVEKRPYQSRFFVFPLRFAKHSETELFLKVNSPNAINLPIQIWRQKFYDRHEIDDHVMQALYFGITIAMIIFNLFLFFILRDESYLLYVLVVFSIAITIAAYNGIASEYIWKNSPWLDQYAINLFISLVLILFLLFMRNLLQTKKILPKLDPINLVLIAIQIILSIAYILSFDTFIRWLVISHSITSLWILIIGVMCSIKKQRIAYFFLLAFAFLFLALIVSTLRALGYIPTNVFTIEGPQYGSAAEMMLLAFALADRYNTIIREKEIAESKVKHNLERSNLDLEEKVKERTFKLNQTLSAMRRDLFVAKNIQENSIQVDPKLLKELKLVYRYLPVSEVGGDFFDIIRLQNANYRILIADATGHGVHAAMITMAIKGLYDPIKEFELKPNQILEIFNDEFMDNFVSLNSLLTAMILDINFNEKTIQFASAGHPAAVLLHDGQKELLTKTGRMIGLKKQTHYDLSFAKFHEGDRLFVFTDGVYEAFNSKNEEFGEENLHKFLMATKDLPLGQVEENLLQTLEHFQNGPDRQDDLTILGFDL